jgi:maltose-binding protein MalE
VTLSGAYTLRKEDPVNDPCNRSNNGPYAQDLSNTIPYYDELISMLSIARARPNIPEYQQISEYILEAINEVYNGTKQPQEALDEAAAKSAEALGW